MTTFKTLIKENRKLINKTGLKKEDIKKLIKQVRNENKENLIELNQNEITPELKKEANSARKTPRKDLINIQINKQSTP